MPRSLDPYLKVVDSFNKHRVRYVLIGVSAINYYAKSSLQILLTGDFDIFVDPFPDNVREAANVLHKLGFSLIANGKGIRASDERGLGKIAAARKTIRAENSGHNLVELSLNVSGFTFDEVNGDALTFRASGVKVRVGRLRKLLKMKEIADRPKDRLFLKRFKLKQ